MAADFATGPIGAWSNSSSAVCTTARRQHGQHASLCTYRVTTVRGQRTISSSSKETVKHFLISSVKALLWWLPPFDPLYLTSFVLRARHAQLTLYRSKGWVEVDQAESYRPLCLRRNNGPPSTTTVSSFLHRLLAAVYGFDHTNSSSPVTLLFRSEAFLP